MWVKFSHIRRKWFPVDPDRADRVKIRSARTRWGFYARYIQCTGSAGGGFAHRVRRFRKFIQFQFILFKLFQFEFIQFQYFKFIQFLKFQLFQFIEFIQFLRRHGRPGGE